MSIQMQPSYARSGSFDKYISITLNDINVIVMVKEIDT